MPCERGIAMSGPLPSHAPAVVVGGGIMGCSTLYHLAEMGVSDAVLIERNQLTSGTTWHSAAQVRALRSSRNLTRMIQYSAGLYSQLERETGLSVGWIQKGSLSIATTTGRLEHIRRQEALARAYGIDARSVSTDEARERWPLMRSDDVLGAVWSPADGRVSPSDVCTALARAATRRGARIFEDTGVTGILTAGSRIKGVETSQGTIMCDAVAVCAGLWSREVGAMAGAEVPVQACEHFYLLTDAIEGTEGNLPTLSDHDGHLYIRDDSGGLLVGCFEPKGKPIAPGVLDGAFAFGLLAEDWDHFEPMMRNALHRIPALETAGIKTLLNGPESFTPDGTFMLGETAETSGLFLGCGMNSIGIAAGGGAGMNLAHCIVHGHTAYDLREADAKRFAPAFNDLDHLIARAPEVLGSHYEITYPGRQFSTARNLRLSPLADAHREAKARFGQFYGWERPLYFGEIGEPTLTFGRPDWFDRVGAEVMAAHRNAAVFDVSPLGKIEVSGPDSEAFLQHVCASDMGKSPGCVIYTAVLNGRGTYESDITVQRIAHDRYRLFVGTNAVKRDFAWFRRHAIGFDVSLADRTEDFAVLGLMGPEATRIASETGATELNQLRYFGTGRTRIDGTPVRAARISFVGEAGWELTVGTDRARSVFDSLLAAGAVPAGLYAQTSMRVEKGFAAMGHELDGDSSPVECGLDALVARKKDFIGSEALASRRGSAARSLVTVVFDDNSAVPVGHEPIRIDGEIVGHTTSAAFGYRIGKPVALAHVRLDDPDGREAEIEVTGNRFSGRMQFAPAFDPSGSRMKGRLA